MTTDTSRVDEVLATTRAVRRRLDLERPVPDEVLLECIDLAEQAPTGGNLSSRRWIVVRDQATKEQLAAVYRDATGSVMAAAERLEGTGHPDEQVMASAVHLVRHLADVPVIVIPTIIGRYDGSGRPGLFDSVIQAAWSFCLALRARGLGTTWMTAALQDSDRVKEILGIPAGMTEIVMFPVAYTKGTDFRRAPRRPAREITYFDRYGVTVERGSSESLRLEDGPGAVTEVDIAASRAAVWSLVSSLDELAGCSGELQGAAWRTAERGVGAVFDSQYQHPAAGESIVSCFVDAWDERRTFGWRTVDPDKPGARWRFDLERLPGGTRLRYSVRLGPLSTLATPTAMTTTVDGLEAPEVELDQDGDQEDAVLRRRLGELIDDMRQTVDGIKARAEAGG